jgi:hypothetical protein
MKVFLFKLPMPNRNVLADGATTFSLMIHSISTFSKMKLSIKVFYVTLSINDI